MEELLTWNPQRDVAKPYPRSTRRRPEAAMIETLLGNVDTLLLLFCAPARSPAPR